MPSCQPFAELTGMKLYYLPGVDPCLNLATEEWIFEHAQEPTLLLWQNDKTIVVGRNQNPLEEIHADFVAARQIRVVRRISGGGAVYHDLQNLNFSFIDSFSSLAETAMTRFTLPVAEALQSMGIPATVSGRNDIVVEGCKVSGNAQAIRSGKILHHGTLLFDVDGTVLEQALAVSPEKLQSKAVQSVRSRVTALKGYLPASCTIQDFIADLVTRLACNIPYSDLGTLVTDPAAVERLREKYASWEWTYGKTPPFSLARRKKFPGGLLEIRGNVTQGCLSTCGFYGDFMAVQELTPLSAALEGIPFTRDAVQHTLSAFPMSEYFGSLSLTEILDCLFENDA